MVRGRRRDFLRYAPVESLVASFRGFRLLVVSPVGLSLFLLVAVVVFLVVFGACALPCSVTCGHSQRKRVDSLGRDSVWSTVTRDT